MTKIFTAMTFAIALGLSMAAASAENGYFGGTNSSLDPANPVSNVGR